MITFMLIIYLDLYYMKIAISCLFHIQQKPCRYQTAYNMYMCSNYLALNVCDVVS